MDGPGQADEAVHPDQDDDGEISEVVSEIDWKAAVGAGIRPGFFGEFTIIGGKLPTVSAR
jgi:uncharacterized protein